MSDHGARHILPVRVYYEDTDAAGIVYYANYLRFAERGRTEMLRSAGMGQRELREREGVAFAVRRCEVDYLAPARLDDALEVHTRVLAITGATVTAEQVVRRGETDLARLRVRLACIDVKGRAVRLPSVLRTMLGTAPSDHAIAKE